MHLASNASERAYLRSEGGGVAEGGGRREEEDGSLGSGEDLRRG